MKAELLLWWFFGTLAVFRVATLVSKEDGPWWIFCKLRKLPPPKSSAREGLACPLCTGLWVSGFICGLFVWAGLRLPWQLWPVLWLSMWRKYGSLTAAKVFSAFSVAGTLGIIFGCSKTTLPPVPLPGMWIM